MHIAIIGGGPAGLRAAEVAAAGGARVTLYDAKPSVGRKFLVAGRGGLNLSKAEEPETFATRYSGPEMPEGLWPRLIGEFTSEDIRAWAGGLGVETMVASTGRIYPCEIKAAPLLRRWVQRLRGLGVEFALRHRWVGFGDGKGVELRFETEAGLKTAPADAAIFAFGGGSWPETGSDGGWVEPWRAAGLPVHPLEPANCGWECAWPQEVIGAAEGQPLKSIAVSAGGVRVLGELMVTRYGLEGGAIYQLGPELRAMEPPALLIDLKPAHTEAQLVAKLGPVTRNLLKEATQRWKLSAAAAALLGMHEPSVSPQAIAAAAKALPIALQGPRPIAEAISSAGGVPWGAVDDGLMLRPRPGVFVAGEMLDWEAPTGGYLIHGCFVLGALAARAAVEWCRTRDGSGT